MDSDPLFHVPPDIRHLIFQRYFPREEQPLQIAIYRCVNRRARAAYPIESIIKDIKRKFYFLAARFGYLNILIWLRHQRIPFPFEHPSYETEVCAEAAKNANHAEAIAVVDWLRGNGAAATEKTYLAAAECGNVTLIEKLSFPKLNLSELCDYFIFRRIRWKSCEFLKWFEQNHSGTLTGREVEIACSAVEHNCEPIVHYLFEKPDSSSYAMVVLQQCALYPNTEIAQLCISRLDFSCVTCDLPVSKVSAEILSQNASLRCQFSVAWDFFLWLQRQTESVSNTFMLSFAAHFGRIDLMEQYLPLLTSRDAHLPCTAASSSGQIIALRWLKQNGFPHDASCVLLTLLSGCMEATLLLHEPSWRYECDIMIYMLLNERKTPPRKEQLDFLLSNRRLALLSFVGNPWEQAVQSGNLSAMEWLLERQFPPASKKLLPQAIESLRAEVIDFLLAQGLQWPDDAMNAAAVQARLDVIRLAHEKGCTSWNESLTVSATSHRDLAMVRYLRQHGCPWSRSTWTEAKEFYQDEPRFVKKLKDCCGHKRKGID